MIVRLQRTTNQNLDFIALVESLDTKLKLETGQKQKEAIQLYKKCGYSITPNYGQYVGIENSLCFKKEI